MLPEPKLAFHALVWLFSVLDQKFVAAPAHAVLFLTRVLIPITPVVRPFK